MMEADGGASIADIRVRNGKRQSVFRSYVFPYMDRSNLTVLSEALVTRVIFEGKRATGVEIYHGGKTKQIRAGLEVVLSLGAINTPKLLMQSGVGDETELTRHGVPVIQHLPGVGQNLQDHPNFFCVWEYPEPLAPQNTVTESVMCWSSGNGSQHPDFFACLAAIPLGTPETIARFGLPEAGWTFAGYLTPEKPWPCLSYRAQPQ
jgi:choline dehydrogenase